MAIKFEINIPVVLAITRMDPRFNEQYQNLMYSIVLQDGTEDKMFLPEEYGETIRNLRIQPREFFSICKRKTGQQAMFYEIKLSPRGPATTAPSKLESQLEASIHHVQAQRAQVPAKVSAPVQPQESCENLQHTSNGTELSQLLAGCMVAAIDAAAIARDYAHTKGLTLSFTEGSIQDLTSTLMIHNQKMAELERRYPAAGGGRDQVNNSVPRAWRQ